jgi:hypothetical protein
MFGEHRVGVAIDRCRGCSHVWFDTFELDRVLKSERKLSETFAVYDVPFRFELAGSESQCPRCWQRTLLSGFIGDVRAWRCSICRGFLVNAEAIQRVRMLGTSAIARSHANERAPMLGSAASTDDLSAPGDAILDLLHRIVFGD